MKARTCPVVFSLALMVLAPLLLRAADAAALEQTFIDPDDPAVAEVRRLGERTINQTGGALIAEMQRVLADHAPALAIGMLHLKDLKLPAPVAGRPAVIAIKRTSLRTRNPANAPDAAELAALKLIQHQLENGDDVAKLLIQRVTLPGRPPEWRVYRPLAAMKQCIACHGTPDALAPGVADTLKVFFPTDHAVDYTEGEWRGLIRVSLADPAKQP